MKIDIKLLGYLILGFIVATVIGTVSHEYGHYLIAKWHGLDPQVHYGFTNWSSAKSHVLITPLDYFWITFGGPLQTMLVGTIGLLLIYRKRVAFREAVSLSFPQWTLVFISLFWLRFLFNFLSGLPYWIQRGKITGRSDEIRMARYLEWPLWSVSLCFATLGLMVLALVLFRFVPKNQRLTFMISGLVGGFLGFYLWLDWLGEKIMP